MRPRCSRLPLLVALSLLPIWLGSLSGCGSKPAEGMLQEPPHVDAAQLEEVKAQYQKRIQARQGKSSKKGKAARPKSAN